MDGIMKLRLPLAMLALALTPLAAPALAGNHPLTSLLIRSFFSRLCHQDPGRSFMIQGSPVAVCVRCLGIYGGAVVAALLNPARATAIRFLGIAALLNVLDVVTGALQWHGNLPLVRLLLGLSLGLGGGAMLFSRQANDRCSSLLRAAE
jgi:uncharacterized membrane protein